MWTDEKRVLCRLEGQLDLERRVSEYEFCKTDENSTVEMEEACICAISVYCDNRDTLIAEFIAKMMSIQAEYIGFRDVNEKLADALIAVAEVYEEMINEKQRHRL